MEEVVRSAVVDHPDLPFMEDFVDDAKPDYGVYSEDEKHLYMPDGTTLKAITDPDCICGIGYDKGPCYFCDPTTGDCTAKERLRCSLLNRKDVRSIYWVKENVENN